MLCFSISQTSQWSVLFSHNSQNVVPALPHLTPYEMVNLQPTAKPRTVAITVTTMQDATLHSTLLHLTQQRCIVYISWPNKYSKPIIPSAWDHHATLSVFIKVYHLPWILLVLIFLIHGHTATCTPASPAQQPAQVCPVHVHAIHFYDDYKSVWGTHHSKVCSCMCVCSSIIVCHT